MIALATPGTSAVPSIPVAGDGIADEPDRLQCGQHREFEAPGATGSNRCSLSSTAETRDAAKVRQFKIAIFDAASRPSTTESLLVIGCASSGESGNTRGASNKSTKVATFVSKVIVVLSAVETGRARRHRLGVDVYSSRGVTLNDHLDKDCFPALGF